MASTPPPGQGLGDELPPTLAKPALRALALAGITGYQDLGGWSAAGLLALHGVGPRAVGILEAGMEARNASFAPGPSAEWTGVSGQA